MNNYQFFVGLVLIAVVMTCSAEIYQWTDASGIVRYGNKPSSSGAEKVKKLQEYDLPSFATKGPLTEIDKRRLYYYLEYVREKKAKGKYYGHAGAKTVLSPLVPYWSPFHVGYNRMPYIGNANRNPPNRNSLKAFLEGWSPARKPSRPTIVSPLPCETSGNKDCSGKKLQDVDYRHRMIVGVSFDNSDLSGAKFNGSRLLNGVTFRGAKLINADFSGAELAGRIDLSGADLTGAKFEGARCMNCNFDQAILKKANFSGSTLIKTSFLGADMRNANLSRARKVEVNFNRANTAGCSDCRAIDDWKRRF